MYPPTKCLEKAVELHGARTMTKNFACAFIGEKKSIDQRREDVFGFKVTYQYIYLRSLSQFGTAL